MSSVRNYFVPRAVSRAAATRPVSDSLHQVAVEAALSGKVRGFHLPLLASGGWAAGAEWAASVLEKESAARERRAQSLLASAGYDPSYAYYGVLDSGYPDHELIVSVARSEDADAPLERWNGMDWGVAEVDPDGIEYVMLDRDVLIDVLDAIDTGSAGVMLRPFEPKAWVRDPAVIDLPIMAAGAPPRNTGVMVALPVMGDVADALSLEDEGGEPTSELHVTLAYLGDMAEDAIDYQAVHHAVARWVRRMNGPLTGEISGPGHFTAGDEPVSVALVDVPALPEARELLIRLLEAEGVAVRKDHGYTPHVTLAYGPGFEGLDVPNTELEFGYATVHYGDDVQEYEFGVPVTAAGGAGPDKIYALVDEFDSSAVLDLVKVLPGPVAYRRSGGKWTKDQNLLMRLMGVDPPPVVSVSAEQAADVLAQVDAYDKENPEKKPVTAAGPGLWDEDKHKRGGGGKFAKKDQSKAALPPQRRPAEARKPAGDPSGPSRGPSRRVAATRRQLEREPWRMLGMNKMPNHLDLGLGKAFWARQPEGFRDFAREFLRDLRREARADGGRKKDDKKKASDDGRNEKGERKGAANDGKRDVAKGDQRSAAQIAAQKKAAAASGKKQGGKNLRDWMKRVPPKYRKAMRDLINAVAEKQDPEARTRARTQKAAKADRRFDMGFARDGLTEARAREKFDSHITEFTKRVSKTGVSAGAVDRVVRKKVGDEKRRRADFERKRRIQAEAERVRRMSVQGRLVAAGSPPAHSMMPGDLKSYWARGEGAAKIRWGTSGDFDRCTRQLRKYLRPDQVKGACANLHKLATGTWPGKGRNH